MTLHKASDLSRPCLLLMMLVDQPDSTELFCKPVQGVGAGPRVNTSKFPSSPVVNISDPKMNCVPYGNFMLNIQGVMDSLGWILSASPFLVRLCGRIIVRYFE
jgi:hypothetical protein